MADMDAGGREGRALRPGTRRAFSGALTLGTMIRVQKIPFTHVVYASVGLAGALLLSCNGETKPCLRAKQQCQNRA